MIASGTQKMEWTELPENVRGEVERVLCSAVVAAETQPGGFSPGVAARVRTRDGRAAFVKSVSSEVNEFASAANRREISKTRALQGNPRVPRLLHAFESGPWTTLVYDLVVGKHPELPWKAKELDYVLSEIESLSDSITPCPQPEVFRRLEEDQKEEFEGWISFSRSGRVVELNDDWVTKRLEKLVEFESAWPQASRGDSLVHTDLRADQILLTSDKAVFVDWPHAAIAAPWIDFLFMFPSVELQGGPDMATLVEISPLKRVRKDDLLPMAVALAGLFMWRCVQPPPPQLPTIRKFQRDQGDVVMRWLKTQGL